MLSIPSCTPLSPPPVCYYSSLPSRRNSRIILGSPHSQFWPTERDYPFRSSRYYCIQRPSTLLSFCAFPTTLPDPQFEHMYQPTLCHQQPRSFLYHTPTLNHICENVFFKGPPHLISGSPLSPYELDPNQKYPSAPAPITLDPGSQITFHHFFLFLHWIPVLVPPFSSFIPPPPVNRFPTNNKSLCPYPPLVS